MLDSLHPYSCVLVVTALVLVKHCQLRNGFKTRLTHFRLSNRNIVFNM